MSVKHHDAFCQSTSRLKARLLFVPIVSVPRVWAYLGYGVATCYDQEGPCENTYVPILSYLSVSVCISVRMTMSVSSYVFFSIGLSVRLSFCRLYVSICVSGCLCLSICMNVCLCICQYLSVFTFVCMSVR